MKHKIELTSEDLRTVLAALDCHWNELINAGLDRQSDALMAVRNDVRDQWSDSIQLFVNAKQSLSHH